MTFFTGKLILFFLGCLIGDFTTKFVFNKIEITTKRNIVLALFFICSISGVILTNMYLTDFMLENMLWFNAFFLGFSIMEALRTILKVAQHNK